ncbi:hypothetical protein I6I57_14020 [Brevibacterium casei]|uniref:DUF4240 domain-containing protein n=1 Tax=Brevibacterium ammoniilyticum TaxID=1046555 RepID=A0ABP9U3I1_9MICO|nr:hypothetical protein [Brevibacterium casei]QQT68806.1 hypothetical protein I6I57_14020 [Brevibacterium casei]
MAELSARTGRADKPALLVHAVGTGVLSEPGELRIALEDTWTGTEWPGLAATRELWVMLFEEALESGMYLDETELRPLQALPETLQVYRAAAAGHEEGMSWTTSFERAHWFAIRLGAIARRPHRIFEMDAPRQMVLASFHASRDEHEYVLDTSRAAPGLRREVLPEEWEYLLAGTLPPEPAGAELDGLGSLPREQHSPFEPSGMGVPEGWVTRAEAIRMVLGMGQGWPPEQMIRTLTTIEALYDTHDTGERLSEATIIDAVHTIGGDSNHEDQP